MDRIEGLRSYGRDGKKENDLKDADNQSISKHLPELAVCKEIGEVSKSDPLALPYSGEDVEILECYYDPPHGQILKADVKQNPGKEEQVQVAVSLDLPPAPEGDVLLT